MANATFKKGLILFVLSLVFSFSTLAQKKGKIKEFSKLPIAVGFGVRDAKTAKEVALISDAVVIGSRIVKEIEDSEGDNLIDNIKKLMVEMKNSINNKAARK